MIILTVWGLAWMKQTTSVTFQPMSVWRVTTHNHFNPKTILDIKFLIRIFLSDFACCVTLSEDVVFLNPCQAPEVLLGQERPTLFSDIWSVSAAILQWLTEYPPWNMQDLCERYRFRENRQLYALQVTLGNIINQTKNIKKPSLSATLLLSEQSIIMDPSNRR